jgi:hypothetical protein
MAAPSRSTSAVTASGSKSQAPAQIVARAMTKLAARDRAAGSGRLRVQPRPSGLGWRPVVKPPTPSSRTDRALRVYSPVLGAIQLATRLRAGEDADRHAFSCVDSLLVNLMGYAGNLIDHPR